MAIVDLLQVTQELTGVPADRPYVSVPLEQLLKLIEAATRQREVVASAGDPPEGVRLGTAAFRPLWRHAMVAQPEEVRRSVRVEDLLLF